MSPDPGVGEPAPPGEVRPKRVAVVIAGAGARGGYEAGVLSVLLPRLEAAGLTPSVMVGTSAGAINATLLAAAAHLPADEQGEEVLRTWRGLRTSDVLRLTPASALVTGGRWLGQLLGVPGARVTGLLDTAPLRDTARTAADWGQLRANLDAGLVELAVVTTSGADNRTVVFVDRAGPRMLPPSDDTRPIDYRTAAMSAEHVLASAAIPILFPPVRVPGRGDDRGGWFLDGGVRLNAPLKPALALDADAVVVVATHPAVDRPGEVPHCAAGEAPDVDDTLVRVLDAALVDRMVEDVATLSMVNRLVEAAGDPGTGHRLVPFLTVGPEDRGTLGRLASDVFDHGGSGLERLTRFVHDPGSRLLGRVLQGDGDRSGDLLSYLYFEPEFLEASIELGRRDAEAAFAGAPAGTVPWRT